MAGAPGSGKSTWIAKHLDAFYGTTQIVSRDSIRFELVAENEPYFSKEKEVYKEFISEIKNGLANYDNVVADATHLNKSSRNKLLNALGSSLKKVEVNIIVMDTCLAKCIDQNKKREGRAFVPEDAINRMYASFEMPTLEEGFDKIFIYRNIGNKTTYEIIEKGE
jgi:predicted kinase